MSDLQVKGGSLITPTSLPLLPSYGSLVPQRWVCAERAWEFWPSGVPWEEDGVLHLGNFWHPES